MKAVGFVVFFYVSTLTVSGLVA